VPLISSEGHVNFKSITVHYVKYIPVGLCVFTVISIVVCVCYVMSHAVCIIILFNSMINLFSFDEFSLNGLLSRNNTVSLIEKCIHALTFLWYELLKSCDMSAQGQNGNPEKMPVASSDSIIRIHGSQIT
jgi:hypothetical protein